MATLHSDGRNTFGSHAGGDVARGDGLDKWRAGQLFFILLGAADEPLLTSLRQRVCFFGVMVIEMLHLRTPTKLILNNK